MAMATSTQLRENNQSQTTAETCLQSALEPSHPSASVTPVKKLLSSPRKCRRLSSALEDLSTHQTDDSGALRNRQTSYEQTWRDGARNEHRFYVSMQIIDRLKSNFTLSKDERVFEGYIATYLKHKYINAQTGDYLYTVPPGFYLLCREIAEVTHELFADAVNCSGVLESFCSASDEDLAFGSKGPWESAEDVVSGGAGHPPSDTSLLRNIISTCERNMLASRPYCRIMIIHAKEDREIDERLYSEDFNGEVIATIPPNLLSDFQHQLDLFRDGCDVMSEEEKPEPEYPLCVVLWINESYLRRHPLRRMLWSAFCSGQSELFMMMK